MKLFVVFFVSLFSISAFADKVTFKVPAFSAELLIEGADFEVTHVKLVAQNQFCNFWGTTCAGGPSDSVTLATSADSSTLDGNTVLNITNLKNWELNTSKVANKFSSCSLTLYVDVLESSGTRSKVWIPLLHSNDKSVCESRDAVLESIRRYVEQKNLHQRLWNH